MKYSNLKQLKTLSGSSHPTPDFISYLVLLLRLLQDHICKMHGWHKPFNSIGHFHLHPNRFQSQHSALEPKREKRISTFHKKSRLCIDRKQPRHCTTSYHEI